MSCLLLVDDDPDQLEIRSLVLQNAGYEVVSASSAPAARRAFNESSPCLVLMDLGLPRPEDGRELIRHLREEAPKARILVLSGWPAPAAELPEAGMVDLFLQKPIRTASLLRHVAKLLVCLWCVVALFPPAWADSSIAYTLAYAADLVLELELSSPGADWSAAGHEAAVATVAMDGKIQHVMLYAGAERHKYRVFLGHAEAGAHTIAIARDARFSSPPCGLELHGAKFQELRPGDSDYLAMAHAPVLFARANTIGKFTDVPMLAYCERLAGNTLKYTVIFSNEDGGTSTRALMARWGRTTDIEHVYVVELDDAGRRRRAIIQARGHKEISYEGPFEDSHPLLIPVTDNNMVSGEGTSEVRYQIAPVVVDLTSASREQVMDENPIAYRVMAQELQREGKLRRFGVAEGSKISDPRNYLYFELNAVNQEKETRIAVHARLEGENVWRASHLGYREDAIERSGWARVALELPPGAPVLAEVGFECLAAEKDSSGAGKCRLEAVSKVFRLGRDYAPGPSEWRLPAPVEIPAGQMRTFPVRQ